MASSLPEWDLSHLYDNPQSDALAQDMAHAKRAANEFVECYGNTDFTALSLAQAIGDYEILSDLLGRIGSYAQLLYAADMTHKQHASFYQNISDDLTMISGSLIFFTLAINALDDDTLTTWQRTHAPLAKYAPWLRDVRALRPYQLSQECEQLLHEKSLTSAAFMRLFDETIARMEFRVGSKKLRSAEAFDLLSHKDPATRKQAARAISRSLTQAAPVLALVTNTLARDKAIDDNWRHFPRPISSRNVSNQVEDEVVDALMQAVEKRYGDTAHRYYALKARWMGQDKLDYWDRNAPLPFADDAHYSWQDAKMLVLDAYRDFSPEMARLGERFFDEHWIDAALRPGKSPGAFAHPVTPSAHPYILVNYQGKSRDVMTLAHELGHGVHQLLAADQGALMCDTPLTLAETASVFGEQLVFQAMLKQAGNATTRKALIAAKVEDMLNTVVRQVAFCQFEVRVHAERAAGELSVERLNAIWLEVQKKSLGSALRLPKEYGIYWSYIPHFIHSPFYVYAYAFGDCLVNSLYATYQGCGNQAEQQVFVEKYFTMLKAGGTLRHKALLAPFGLDTSRPEFWDQGLDILSGLIDQLEA